MYTKLFLNICLADSDRANNNSLIAHISNLPGFDASKARFIRQYSTKTSPVKSTLEIVPTAAELMLPWRHDHSYHSLIGTFLIFIHSLIVQFYMIVYKYIYCV